MRNLTSEIMLLTRPRGFSRTDINVLVLAVLKRNQVSENYSLKTALSATNKICADKTQIYTVLENIIKNALEAMPGGGALEVLTSIFLASANFLRERME